MNEERPGSAYKWQVDHIRSHYLPYCVWKVEIKDTTATGRSASNIDLHLEIDSESWLRTKLYDKRDDYNFPIVNFPFICSNISAASPSFVTQIFRNG
jgi:hypothetical protein